METHAMAALPEGSPILKAWRQYKASKDYGNSWTWAAQEKHREGSMWAAFLAGWQAAQQSTK